MLLQADTMVQPLAEDIAHYKRAKYLYDKSGYSFQYLFDAADRYILMKREDAMQELLSRSLMGATDRAAPGVDPKPKGTGGKGDKGTLEKRCPRRRQSQRWKRGSPKANHRVSPSRQVLACEGNIAGTRM